MSEFLNKKNIINLLLLGIMVLAIPITVRLVRLQQVLFSRAAEAKVEFLTKEFGGTDCVINRGGKQVAVCKDLTVRLAAPTGADIKLLPSTIPSSTPSASPSSSPLSTSLFSNFASLVPRGGLVSKVYAENCNEGGAECWDGESYWVVRDRDTNEVCSTDGPYGCCDEGCDAPGAP